VINIIKKNEILIKYKNGLGIKTIARDLGISKNTVKTYVREYNEKLSKLSTETDKSKIAIIQDQICAKPSRKKYIKTSPAFTPDVERRFYELIKIDENRASILGPNKQNLTAALLHRTLVLEGYKISESTIRSRYKEYKGKNKECFIKQHYEYGQRAEYDFHQIKVKVGSQVKVYHQATISLPKSNYVFAALYKNERMESFLDSLVLFFSHCNGVFNELVFDNMSNAVKRFVYKGEKELTSDLLKISNYYSFKVNLTNPRSGNEKGHVENSGKTVRRDMFSLKYEFIDEADLFLYFDTELEKRNSRFLEEFKKEREYLSPKPVHDYELGRIQSAKVNSYSLVSIDSNFYSVPDKYVSKTVVCIVYTSFIIIYDDLTNQIARHNKKDGKGEYQIDIKHYIDTFLKKPGALRNSLALKQAPQVLQTIFNEYFITEPKKFLEFMINSNAFDDIDRLAMQYGFIKYRPKPRVNPKYLAGYYDNTIDEISKNQLDYTAQLFGQKGSN
jgi:transposase